jgi:hypothetical protein
MAYYDAYDPYDNHDSYGRSRKHSFGYRSTTPLGGYPYHGTAYSEPMMRGEYSSSYPMYPSNHRSIYRTPNHSAHYLPYDDMDYRGGAGLYPPLVQPLALGRPRRASSVSYSPRPPAFGDPFRRNSPPQVKFKRKGAFRGGITLGEAQANVRLAGYDSYTFNDLGVDHRGKIYVKVSWPGYSPLNYEIPVDGYGGLVDLQSLTRRIARAVTHYLQANIIPIPADRIELSHMDEVSMGTWHLKLSTY